MYIGSMLKNAKTPTLTGLLIHSELVILAFDLLWTYIALDERSK